MQQIVVTTEAYQFPSYVQNFIQYPAVNMKFIRRGNNWESTAWISTQQVNYWYFLHSSKTRKK